MERPLHGSSVRVLVALCGKHRRSYNQAAVIYLLSKRVAEGHNQKPAAGSHCIKDSPSNSSEWEFLNEGNVPQIQCRYIPAVWICSVWRQPVSSSGENPFHQMTLYLYRPSTAICIIHQQLWGAKVRQQILRCQQCSLVHEHCYNTVMNISSLMFIQTHSKTLQNLN